MNREKRYATEFKDLLLQHISHKIKINLLIKDKISIMHHARSDFFYFNCTYIRYADSGSYQ